MGIREIDTFWGLMLCLPQCWLWLDVLVRKVVYGQDDFGVGVGADAAATVMGIIYETAEWVPTGAALPGRTAPRVSAVRSILGLSAVAVVAVIGDVGVVGVLGDALSGGVIGHEHFPFETTGALYLLALQVAGP